MSGVERIVSRQHYCRPDIGSRVQERIYLLRGSFPNQENTGSYLQVPLISIGLLLLMGGMVASTSLLILYFLGL